MVCPDDVRAVSKMLAHAGWAGYEPPKLSSHVAILASHRPLLLKSFIIFEDGSGPITISRRSRLRVVLPARALDTGHRIRSTGAKMKAMS